MMSLMERWGEPTMQTTRHSQVMCQGPHEAESQTWGGARAASRGNALSILDNSRVSSGFEGPNVSMGRREKIHDLKTAVCYGALSGSQIPKMPEVIRTTC